MGNGAGRDISLLAQWWPSTDARSLAATIVDVLEDVGGHVRPATDGGADVTLDAAAVRALRRRGLVIRNSHYVAANRAMIPATTARVQEVRAFLTRTRGAPDDLREIA